MRITVIGRGHVGGGLAERWAAAGHDLTGLGRTGGDATGADAVVVATPGDAVEAALAAVSGLDGQVTITERLIRDAGFAPVHLGDLGQAPLLEGLIALTAVLARGDLGPFFYRFDRPGDLSAALAATRGMP
jgi:predicted dinucleotide-binding enzyme